MPFGLLKLGILLGIGAAAPIGPVNVEIARRTLRSGFWAGFAVGCGGVSVDVLYAIVSSQGFKRYIERPIVLQVLGVAGAALLLYLATFSLRAAWRASRADPLDEATPLAARSSTIRSGYFTGVLMMVLNPMTLAFWFVAVPGAVGPITKEPSRDLPMICAGVFVGTLAWVVSFAGVLSFTGAAAATDRKKLRTGIATADAVGGLTLLGFALLALWRLRGSFL